MGTCPTQITGQPDATRQWKGSGVKARNVAYGRSPSDISAGSHVDRVDGHWLRAWFIGLFRRSLARSMLLGEPSLPSLFCMTMSIA